jgi:SAM-dependent methyltransferase
MRGSNRNETQTMNKCICGQAMIASPYSEKFNVLNCVCGSKNFVPSSNAHLNNFEYDGTDAKYGTEAYLSGSVFRWAHFQISDYIKKQRQGKPCRTLEVGCFNGAFVKKLMTEGVDAFGVDLNQTSILTGAAKWSLSERLFYDNNEAIKYGPFDYVILIDVLEHLEDPYSAMHQFIEYLSANGEIIVSGPVSERFFLDKSDFPPHHLWRFSRVALDKLGHRLGLFTIELLVQYDFPLFLRNFVGRLRNGFFKREYRGEAFSVTDEQIPTLIRITMKIIGAITNPVLKFLKIPYCASIQIYKKI